MKFLVAALGNQLSSFVAKRFEHAAWYLVIDNDLIIEETTQHLSPHDRHALLQKALTGEFDVIVAGKLGDNTRKVLRSSAIRFAPIHGVTISTALGQIHAGQSDLVNVEEASKEHPVPNVQQQVKQIRREKSAFSTTGYSSDSSRGHHHLQQYGGRGH